MMQKIPFLLFFVLILSACSMSIDQILGRSPTPMPGPPSTNTPTAVPTLTPTVPSPTKIVQPKNDLTPFPSPTPLLLTQPGVIPLSSSSPVALVTQVKMVGFVSVTVSEPEFYKGTECLPISAKITAQVSDVLGTAFVVLFVRFKSRQTGATSEWTSIGMQPAGIPGFYSHELVPEEMKAVESFKNAWVEYQVVSTDAKTREIGRTGIFSERLTLLDCMMTATPTASITPTVLVP